MPIIMLSKTLKVMIVSTLTIPEPKPSLKPGQT